MFQLKESILNSRGSFEIRRLQSRRKRAHTGKEIVTFDTSGYEVDIAALTDDEYNYCVNVADVVDETCDTLIKRAQLSFCQ